MTLQKKIKAYKLKQSLLDKLSNYFIDEGSTAYHFEITSVDLSSRRIETKEYYYSKDGIESNIRWKYEYYEMPEEGKEIYKLLKKYYDLTKENKSI